MRRKNRTKERGLATDRSKLIIANGLLAAWVLLRAFSKPSRRLTGKRDVPDIFVIVKKVDLRGG
jgi:hypothetical protein